MVKNTNILIIEDDTKTADNLRGFLSRQENVKKVECASSVQEAYEILNQLAIDVVVLDLIMSVSDGYYFLESLSHTPVMKKPDVIVTSAIGSEQAIRKAFDMGAKYYMIKPYENEIMYRRIVDVLELELEPKGFAPGQESQWRGKSIDQKIMEIFLMLGIPPHLKGYQYLREAIKIAVADPSAIYSITKYLYPEIARRFEVTSTKVELAIRHTLEVAWQRNKLSNLNQVFGCDVYLKGSKPTNGEFIALVADKLVTEQCV